MGYHNTSATFKLSEARLNSGETLGEGFYVHLDKAINDKNLKAGQHTMEVPLSNMKIKEYIGKGKTKSSIMNSARIEYINDAKKMFPKDSLRDAQRKYNKYLVEQGYDGIRISTAGHGDMINIINKKYLESIGD